jgi:hypothetical protein
MRAARSSLVNVRSFSVTTFLYTEDGGIADVFVMISWVLIGLLVMVVMVYLWVGMALALLVYLGKIAEEILRKTRLWGSGPD